VLRYTSIGRNFAIASSALSISIIVIARVSSQVMEEFQMGRLTGKVALITGCSQGLGLGVARVFAREGANLAITGRVADRLERVKPELEALGAKVMVCPGDGSVRANAQRAVQAAIDLFGQLDILVNNAQTTKSGVMVEDISDDDVQVTFGSGFLATLYHMQAAFPHLQARGGSIINFGTKVGIHPNPGQGAYAANKEAIRGLSRVTAKEWGRHKIRVNVVNPASVTPSAAAYFKQFPEEEAHFLKDISLGYYGDAEKDIGAVALFLASDDSRYVTGQTINVDGGQVML
jgi:NAD(P)-dependent dehydrogenase (short-subunit alcohol dehydrogenase family)